MSKPAIDIGGLTDAERLHLIEQLWDSLEAKDELPMSEAQARELAAREAALDAGTLETLPFEEVIAALRTRRV